MLAVLAVAACAAGGANGRVGAMAVAGAGFAVAAAVFGAARPCPLPRRAWVPVLAGLMGFLAWAAVPAIGAGLGVRGLAAPLSGDLFWPRWLEAAGMVAVFGAAAVSGLRRGNRDRCARWLCGLGAALFLGTPWVRLALPLEEARTHRLAGSLGNPNLAGITYAMLALVALAVARVELGRWRQSPRDGRLLAALGAGGTALGGAVLVGLTQSRGGLGLMLLGMAPLVLPRGAGRRWRALRVAGLGAAGGLLWWASAATLDRLAPVDADGLGRVAIWRAYWALAGHAPLAGWGLGSFAESNARALTPQTAPLLWSFGAAHAAPLQLVLETGWPGLALLGGAVVLVIGQIARHWRPGADPVGAAMLLAVLVALCGGMVDIALNVPGIALLAVVLAGHGWGRALRARYAGGMPARRS